jgi:hypothetical protein
MTAFDMPIFLAGVKMVSAEDYNFVINNINGEYSSDMQAYLQHAFRTKVLDEIYEHL